MTTTFQSALTSPDYTKLRGTTGNNPWWGRQFITLCSNTVVFAARVVSAPAIVTSVASFGYNSVSVGAYTDVEVGETILISHTNDIRDAYWRGRIRKAPTSGTVYINETSINLAGNDYFWVVYDFDIWDVLSRMVGSTQYWDYDIAYHKLAPVTVGLQTAYVSWNPDDSVYHIDFDVSTSYPADIYSTPSLTFQFTFVAGTYTVTSGALNTAVVGVDFDANTEQWGKLVITDSQGTTWTRRFYIRVHGSTDTPSLDFTGAQITGAIDSGWNATVSAWNGVSSVLAQTFTVIWSQEYYNGVLGPVSIANNIDMIGRFHREENHGAGDALYSYVTDVKFDIEGIATQLARLEMQDLTTINKSTATVVDEISFNTPERSIVYYWQTHCTVLSLCDLRFPGGFDLTYHFQFVTNQGGNCYDAIQGIAQQFNANVEFAPDGRIQIVRDTRYLTDKSGVVVVGNFTTADFTEIPSLSQDAVQKTGKVDADGVSYNSGVSNVFLSRAPGNAQGYAGGSASLAAQILEATSNAALAQSELNYRAGQLFAIENLTYTQGWKSTTGGYHFLIPSRAQRVTHTYASATNARGLTFNTSDYWQVVGISISHNNADGSREVNITEELEPPQGDSGDTVPQIAGGTQNNEIVLTPTDPFPSIPDDPGNYTPDDPTPPPYPPLKLPRTGSVDIYTDGTDIWITKNIFLANPVWTGVTPSDRGSFVFTAVCFDLTSTGAVVGAYALGNDTSDSAIWYTSDVFATPVVWTKGAPFTGAFDQIRSVGINGNVMAYSSDVTGTDTTINFQATNGGLVNQLYSNYGQTASPDQSGTWVAGAGWQQTLTNITSSPNTTYQSVFVGLPFMTPKTITKIKFVFDRALGTQARNIETDIFGLLSGGIVFTQSFSPGPTGTNQSVIWTGNESLDLLVFATNAGAANSPTDPGGTCTLKSITYTEGGGNSKVAYSTDFGATATVIDLGSAPGPIGAFDTVRIGGASLASANGQVKIATSVGGAYSNAVGGTLSAGQPVTIAIPYRRWPHGTAQYSASDPDYLLVGSQAISGAAVWKVNGSTGALTDITPTGGIGVGPNLATAWQSSSVCKLAIVVNVAGIYKLYTSLDAGATWTFRRNVGQPIFLRCRRNDLHGTQLYLLDGSSLYMSSNWGVSWAAHTLPSTNNGVYLDIYW